jgi:hypothetical protein
MTTQVDINDLLSVIHRQDASRYPIVLDMPSLAAQVELDDSEADALISVLSTIRDTQAKPDTLGQHVKAAKEAAHGDSNDEEIELLQNALDVTLSALGRQDLRDYDGDGSSWWLEGDDEDPREHDPATDGALDARMERES